MSTEVLTLVQENPHFEVLENGKIRCKLTNHEINPQIEKIQEYIKSKGYQKAIEKDFNFDQYKPHIVPFKGAEDNFLFCHLTRTKVPKMKNVILRHVEGRKYQRLVQLYNQKKQEREERKKITLLKCKKVSLEEEDDKFDERYIDRMINEFEEDERLNNNDLDGEESYSDQIYDKINTNYIQEEVKKSQKKKAEKRNLKAKKQQEEEGDDDENEDDLDEEDYDSQEDDGEDEEGDDEDQSEIEGEDIEEEDEEEEEEIQLEKPKQQNNSNGQKQNNFGKKKFQNKPKHNNGNNQQNNNHNNQNNNKHNNAVKQGKKIKKQKQFQKK